MRYVAVCYGLIISYLHRVVTSDVMVDHDEWLCTRALSEGW